MCAQYTPNGPSCRGLNKKKIMSRDEITTFYARKNN